MTARLRLLHHDAAPAPFPEMNAREQAEFAAAVQALRAERALFEERARTPVLVASNPAPEPCALPPACLRAIPEAEPEMEAEP